MTWHFYALQQESDRQSRALDEGDGMGVAVFRLGGYPRDPGPFELRLVERDRSLEGGQETSEDDEVGRIRGEVSAGAPTFEAEAQSAGAASDPALIVKVLVTGPPAAEHQWTLRVPAGAIDADDVADAKLELGLLGPDQGWDHQAPVHVRLHRSAGDLVWDPAPEVVEDEEWDRLAVPTDGQKLFGYPIRVREEGGDTVRRVILRDGDVEPKLVRYGRNNVDRWGIIYMGRSRYSCLHDAKQSLKEEYLGAGDHYKKLLVDAYELLGEGEVSAINSYDNMVLTLGAGYAFGRLNRCHRLLEGRPRELLAEALSGLDCFEGGVEIDAGRFPRRRRWSDEARIARLHAPTLARYVQLTEHRRYCFDFARINLLEYVGYDGVGEHPRAADLRWGNQQAPRWPGELPQLRGLAGMTAYLRHGRPGYVRHPIADVKLALTHATTPSAQIAVICKLHAEKCWHGGQFASDAAKRIMQGALGMKMRIFQEAMRADTHDASWELSLTEAHGVIPCLKTSPRPATRDDWNSISMFQGQDAAPAAANVFLYVSGKYYDFGRPLRETAPASTAIPAAGDDDEGGD